MHSLRFFTSKLLLVPVLFSVLLSSSPVLAEIWLTESAYLESQHLVIFNQKNSDKNTIQTLSQIDVNQALAMGRFQLTARLNADNKDFKGFINQAKLVTNPLPYVSFSLGRFIINYQQEDLFNTSLGKNQGLISSSTVLWPSPQADDQEKSYNQGFITEFQLGFIRQVFFINQSQQNQTSYHYRLKLGIPGYKFGPLDFIFEQLPKGYLNQPAEQSLALLGGSLQFPMPSFGDYQLPGAWQWSFQLGKGFKQSAQAWQSSIAWLGFLPKHKFGLMRAETDKAWIYSSDFHSQQSSLQARYQITLSQTINISAAALKLKNNADQAANQVLQLGLELDF